MEKTSFNEKSLKFESLSNERVSILTSLSKEKLQTIARESNITVQYLFITLTILFQGMTQRCAGAIFGYSQAAISKIISKTLFVLKNN